jgi:hypothetical protein
VGLALPVSAKDLPDLTGLNDYRHRGGGSSRCVVVV